MDAEWKCRVWYVWIFTPDVDLLTCPGNAQGNVILFEPSTSEHISARTIDQIPVTALAPAADCRTYAIG